MATDLQQAHRRLLTEVFNQGNLAAFDELCSPDYLSHDPVTGDSDLAHEKQNCAGYRMAFPDLAMTITAQHLAGDTVTTRWRCEGTHRGPLMGIAATGKRAVIQGVSIGRFKGGKLVEDWVVWDAFGTLCQLGAIRLEDLARTAAAPERRVST